MSVEDNKCVDTYWYEKHQLSYLIFLFVKNLYRPLEIFGFTFFGPRKNVYIILGQHCRQRVLEIFLLSRQINRKQN